MRGTIGLSLVVTALAGCLAQPAQFSIGESGPENDPRNFTWVKEGVLAVGGGGLTESDVEWLAEADFTAVANFREEHYDPGPEMKGLGIEHLHLPVVHGTDINATQLRSFVSWQQGMEAQGRVTYAHCTNGWHRGAAFAVAYLMSTGIDYDAAADLVEERRRGTLMRALGGLLAFQQELRAQPGLHVLLLADQSRPETRIESMPARVEVGDAAGRPVSGASVRVWSEESKMRMEGTTGPDGLFLFDYRAPDDEPMDHVYARASYPGLLDGGDAIEVFFRDRPPSAKAVVAEVDLQGEELAVRVLMHGVDPVRGRVMVYTATGGFFLEPTGTGHASFQVRAEDLPVQVRVESWGAVAGHATLAG